VVSLRCFADIFSFHTSRLILVICDVGNNWLCGNKLCWYLHTKIGVMSWEPWRY
jgi:hypothetical protein